jgi:hypothetical protein
VKKTKSKRCAVEQGLGGGIFRCNRPVITGSFCEYHGAQDARTLDLQLTPRAWLKKWFIYTPQYWWQLLRALPRKMRTWWRKKNNPPCCVNGCREKSDLHGNIDGEMKPLCIDHYVSLYY